MWVSIDRQNVGPKVHCFEQKPGFDYVNTTCQTRTLQFTPYLLMGLLWSMHFYVDTLPTSISILVLLLYDTGTIILDLCKQKIFVVFFCQTPQNQDNAELFVNCLEAMVETCLPGDDLDVQNPYPSSLGIASNLNLSSSMSSLSMGSLHSPTGTVCSVNIIN